MPDGGAACVGMTDLVVERVAGRGRYRHIIGRDGRAGSRLVASVLISQR
jgi:hypothetical protein